MNQQTTLFGDIFTPFGGKTYEPEFDAERLTGQYQKVFALMSDSKWRTLREIQAITGGSEAGISARLRDARKPAFGSHTVDRRRREPAEKGVFEYRLTASADGRS